MAFEPVNVQDNPAAQAELAAVGAPIVPVTVAAGGHVHGWNPGALARLVGVELDDTPALKPRELAESLDNILYYAEHLLRRLDGPQLDLQHPERPRSLRDLIYHAFRLSAAFVDAMEQGVLRREWLEEVAPAGVRSPAAIADYGSTVRARLSAWFEASAEASFRGSVETYYGGQSVHLLLERTAWHAGQHLRQVYDLLQTDRSLPVPPLAPELFEGLPMPGDLW